MGYGRSTVYESTAVYEKKLINDFAHLHSVGYAGCRHARKMQRRYTVHDIAYDVLLDVAEVMAEYDGASAPER